MIQGAGGYATLDTGREYVPGQFPLRFEDCDIEARSIACGVDSGDIANISFNRCLLDLTPAGVLISAVSNGRIMRCENGTMLIANCEVVMDLVDNVMDAGLYFDNNPTARLRLLNSDIINVGTSGNFNVQLIETTGSPGNGSIGAAFCVFTGFNTDNTELIDAGSMQSSQIDDWKGNLLHKIDNNGYFGTSGSLNTQAEASAAFPNNGFGVDPVIRHTPGLGLRRHVGNGVLGDVSALGYAITGVPINGEFGRNGQAFDGRPGSHQLGAGRLPEPRPRGAAAHYGGK